MYTRWSSAYRRLLDGKITLEEARRRLAHDFGRAKTHFFLGGARQAGFINAARAGAGVFLGAVSHAGDNGVLVKTREAVAVGDRIRIQPGSGFEGASADVCGVTSEADGVHIHLKKAVECRPGDEAYLIGSGIVEERFGRQGFDGTPPIRYQACCPDVRKILSRYGAAVTAAGSRDTLWVRVDTAAWLDYLAATPCQRLVFAGERREAEALLADEERLRVWRSRLVLALPPFIPEGETREWRTVIARFRKAGVRRGVCSNIGHQALFGNGFDCIADASLWCLNRASQAALRRGGFGRFVYSWEDDYLNMKAAASPAGIVCLFSRVPLFVSRVHPAVKMGLTVTDPHGNRFVTVQAHGMYCLLRRKAALPYSCPEEIGRAGHP